MKSLLILVLSILTTSMFSQIVNIENKRLFNKNEGVNGSAEVNFDYTLNTKEVLKLGNKIRINYLRKKHQLLLVTDHSIIKTDGNNSINKGFLHLRYNYTVKDSGRWSFEAYQQVQFNQIQKIDIRALLGTGFRVNLIDKISRQLIAGTGIMAEYEDLIGIGTSLHVLSSSYLSFDYQITKSVGLNTICYIQPKITDLGNYRFSNETSLRFIISKHLDFKVSYSVTHDSRDIEGVRKTNYVVKNALRMRL